jgi:hypothetical protein
MLSKIIWQLMMGLRFVAFLPIIALSQLQIHLWLERFWVNGSRICFAQCRYQIELYPGDVI